MGKISTVDGRNTVEGKRSTVEGNEFALVNVGKEQKSKKAVVPPYFFLDFWCILAKGRGRGRGRGRGKKQSSSRS